MLREYIYRDAYLPTLDYLPENFDRSEDEQKKHLGHCIEILRLSVMCAGDVTPILSEVAPEEKGGYRPDFNTMHKCRDFEGIREWVDGHLTDLPRDSWSV